MRRHSFPCNSPVYTKTFARQEFPLFNRSIAIRAAFVSVNKIRPVLGENMCKTLCLYTHLVCDLLFRPILFSISS